MSRVPLGIQAPIDRPNTLRPRVAHASAADRLDAYPCDHLQAVLHKPTQSGFFRAIRYYLARSYSELVGLGMDMMRPLVKGRGLEMETMAEFKAR
jgi:hypothetical protein